MYQNAYRNSVTGAEYDEGLRQFMLSVFNNMGLGLAISAAIAYFVGTTPDLLTAFFSGPQKWIVMLAPLAMVFFISFKINDLSPEMARSLFYAYAGLMGLSLATIFATFAMGSIATAFFSTAAMFSLMSIWGHTTQRDLTSMGSFLFMGLIGVVVASLINLFLESSALAFVVSLISVVVFSGLTAYDVQQLKAVYYNSDSDTRERAGVIGALSLYLNFINIFLSLLQLFGDRK